MPRQGASPPTHPGRRDAHHGGSVRHWRHLAAVTDGGGGVDMRRASNGYARQTGRPISSLMPYRKIIMSAGADRETGAATGRADSSCSRQCVLCTRPCPLTVPCDHVLDMLQQPDELRETPGAFREQAAGRPAGESAADGGNPAVASGGWSSPDAGMAAIAPLSSTRSGSTNDQGRGYRQDATIPGRGRGCDLGEAPRSVRKEIQLCRTGSGPAARACAQLGGRPVTRVARAAVQGTGQGLPRVRQYRPGCDPDAMADRVAPRRATDLAGTSRPACRRSD